MCRFGADGNRIGQRARRLRCGPRGLAGLAAPPDAGIPARSGSGRQAAGESACRPGSVHPLARAGGHPSGTAIAGSLVRSTRELGRAALKHSRRPRGRNRTALLDLAPGGVCQAARVTPGAGGLLHHRFTLTPGQAGGGLFSVALSRGSPRVGVTDHPALRSPDLPPRVMEAMTRRGRPAGSPAAAPRIVRYPPGCRRCAVSFSDRSSAGPSANQSISVSDATSR